MHPEVLLENEGIREVAAADGTSMDGRGSGGRLAPVDAHVRLQVTLRRERTTAELAAVRAFAGVRAVVHLEGTPTAEDAMADGALVRVRDLPPVDVLDQFVEASGGLGDLDLHELFQRIVILRGGATTAEGNPWESGGSKGDRGRWNSVEPVGGHQAADGRQETLWYGQV